MRRGNLFDNQWLMRLLRFARNDKLDVVQRSPVVVIAAMEKIGLERIAVSVVTVMELYYGACTKPNSGRSNVICYLFEYCK